MDEHSEEEPMISNPHRRRQTNLGRRLGSPAILFVFLLSILWLGTTHDYAQRDGKTLFMETTYKEGEVNATGHRPDFGQFKPLHTIRRETLRLEEPDRRLIVVGDIHGMADSFEKLLRKVAYNPKSDTLIHLGDIVAKGPHPRRILSTFAAQNITGVRGNHDQKVIQWRAFMNWVKEQRGGKDWFEELVEMDLTPKKYKKLRKSKKKFQTPDENWGAEHWHIAKKMTREEYEYLRNLPLTIHIPSLHTFLVHAGLLAFDPTRDIYDLRQPLSHPPSTRKHKNNIDDRREQQERTLLSDIRQNRNPWNTLNIRDVTKKGYISRKAGDGRPWAELWNDAQKLCKGFDSDFVSSADFEYGDGLSDEDLAVALLKKRLPCYPTSVIYGHAAGRGLDIQRWTKGIDTGCVYGGHLTALIFGNDITKEIDDAGDEEEVEELRFGDSYKARIARVKCKEP